MKFPTFKAAYVRDANEAIKYLTGELSSVMRSLNTGLSRLSFGDNFESFEETVTITAGQELAIRNQLNVTPTRRVIVRHSGDPSVVDGPTAWNENYVYLKNTGAADATVTVVFMR